MDRLVAALDRRQHPRQGLQQQQYENGIEVKLYCIRPFDSDGVAFLDGFLYGNTNAISRLNISLCDLISRPQSRHDNDDSDSIDGEGRERDDRVVVSSSSTNRSTATPTTALDVICRFLASPREQHATALKSITFMACHLTNEHARRIVHALRYACRHQDPTITQLDLSRNDLHGVDGGVILGDYLILLSLQLTQLNISRNAGLGPDAMMQSNLRLGLNRCKNLVKLNLHGCKIGNLGLSQLCLSLDKDAPIEEFDIGDNDLRGSTAGVCLAFIVQQMVTRLVTLDVSCNPQLGADGVMALGKALVYQHQHHYGERRLQTLSLSECGMGNVGIGCLDQALKESLLGNNHNGNNGVLGIYKSLRNLHLARNHISNGAALGSLLQPFAGLQRCTLSGNPLGPSGAAGMGPVAVHFLCHALQHLQMTNCRLGNAGIDYMITHVFAKTPSLQTIQLGSNHDDVLYPPMMPLAIMGHGHTQQQQHQPYAALHFDTNQGAPRSLPATQPEKCAACQEYYREKAELEKLPCGRHYLHSSCLHSWRSTASANTTTTTAQQCPLCREEEQQQQESATFTAALPPSMVAASPPHAKVVVASPTHSKASPGHAKASPGHAKVVASPAHAKAVASQPAHSKVVASQPAPAKAVASQPVHSKVVVASQPAPAAKAVDDTSNVRQAATMRPAAAATAGLDEMVETEMAMAEQDGTPCNNTLAASTAAAAASLQRRPEEGWHSAAVEQGLRASSISAVAAPGRAAPREADDNDDDDDGDDDDYHDAADAQERRDERRDADENDAADDHDYDDDDEFTERAIGNESEQGAGGVLEDYSEMN
jgi:Ring finger domain/Leucine Rich repeat